MGYVSLSSRDRKKMLDALGIASLDELFCCVPEAIRLKRDLNLPGPLTEPELLRHFEEIADRNSEGGYLSFLGAGAYRHYIPSVVDYLSSRGEFLSPYTPYQPEVSQGTLQVIFEYQTLISQLTGMEIANASLYEGASATAEAVLMAHRLKGKPKVILARTLHPQYKSVIQAYIKNLSMKTGEAGYNDRGEIDLDDLARKIDAQTAAVVCQSPNFLGVVENWSHAAELAHKHDALFIAVVAEAASLGILKTPGAGGADIVSGEGQSFGLPLSFGGPYLGFMACKKDFVRQFPGRIVGETRDAEGKRGFVLTLATREQHIRREKATSNICTNQAWCALRATIFLESLGREGMRDLAHQNIQKAAYALEKLAGLRGVRRKFGGPVFNEFALEFSSGWPRVEKHLRANKVLGGLSLEPLFPELKNCALFCVTEVHRKEDLDRLVGLVGEALR
jgi:glycine dehydrogenase subunit 1